MKTQTSVARIALRHVMYWAGLYAVAFWALLAGIGTTPLIEPDEGRNAEVSREMATGSDFVTPRLNALPYLDKPVFFFATAAISTRILGATELAVRLPSALFSIATSLILMAWAWRRFGRDVALVAGLAFATAPLVQAFARIVIFDATFTFWVTAACIAFDIGRERDHRGWIAAAWIAAGIATLTKGPIGLALPLLVECGRALATSVRLAPVFQPTGLLCYALVVGPWFLALSLQHPEFPHYAIVRETLQRVATNRMDRGGPFWYFAPPLLGGFLPWILAGGFGARSVLEAWRQRRGGMGARVHLLVWIILPTILFTLSQSKRPGYVLPVIPPLAVWCALLLVGSARVRRRTGLVAAAIAFSAAVVLGIAVEPIALLADSVGGIDELLPARALPIGLALALGAAMAAHGARVDAMSWLVAGLALLPAATLLTSVDLLHAMGASRSTRSLASSVAELASDTRIVGVATYPASLSFYVGQTYPVAAASGSPFKSNYIAEYGETLRLATGSTLKPQDWWRSALAECAVPTVFVVKSSHVHTRDELAAVLPELGDSGRYAVYGPCAPESQGHGRERVQSMP